MTGSTKILTVSYGTFSCTLEGFDDPFGTMRGIAEYFRDLAADDRYFGAEPPTPDVEMLQRIAEKEVQRRVEARLGEGSVALTQLSSETASPVATESEQPEPEVQSEVRARPTEPSPRPQPEQEEVDLDHGPLAHDDEYLLSDEPEDVLAVDPDARVPAEGPAETVAEKLRRIRAVVSRSIEPEAGDGHQSFSAPQAPVAGANEGTPKRDRALTETIRQITEDLSDDDDEPEDVADEDNLFEEQETVSRASDDDDGWNIGLETPAEDIEEEIEAVSENAEEDDGWDIDLDSPQALAEDQEEEAPEAAVHEEEADEDTGADDILTRVLARKDEDTSQPLRLDAESEIEPARKERRTSRPLSPISETNGDVGRLLAETDNQLNDDESVRRRRVISQMRAAVAATKADRLVTRRVTSREEEDAAEQERYRDDLNEAVGEVTRSLPPKPGERRPSVAPLVLVSSQRVDEAKAPVPTRPELRRAESDVEDFAGFAKSMGAKELPDLLEAAAAYTSFIEGQTSFSRPEIMKRVARVDPTLKLSREDGLRSFGQLLRQGKFRKLERGQFTIAEDTRFRPEQRIAGE